MPNEPNPVRNAIISLLVAGLTAAPLVFLAVNYPEMPDRVPVHWNIHGAADRWAAKSFLAVFFAPILSVLVQIMLALLTSDLAKAAGAVQGADEASNYKRASLQANLGLMQPVRFLLAGMLCVIAFIETLNSTTKAPQWTSALLPAIVAALLLVTLLGVVKIVRLQRKWESAAASREPEFQAENWRWGGAVYYNREDANFLVHKRLGAGFTLNFAHSRAKLYALLLVAIIAFTFVAAVSI